MVNSSFEVLSLTFVKFDFLLELFFLSDQEIRVSWVLLYDLVISSELDFKTGAVFLEIDKFFFQGLDVVILGF